MDLRGYQVNAFNEINGWLAAGERDILLESPVGSGKTNTVKALLAAQLAGHMRLAVVLVPQILLEEQWGFEGAWKVGPDVFALPDAGKVEARDFTPAWLRTASGVVVMTRQAFTKRRAVLESLPSAALADVVVVVDEGHHCADITKGGEALEMARTQGAATLLVSATPWATSGDVERSTTKAHRLSDAEYVMCFEEGSPCRPPGEFAVDIVKVGRPTSKAFDTFDDSRAKCKGIADERPHALKICAAMAKRWASDGFPRAVMNVPRTFWAPMLLKALVRVRKAVGKSPPEVLDLAGDGVDIDAAQAQLKADSDATHIRRVRLDAVISCVRMDEGLDWVPCSHVYNAGIPSVPRIIIQRWGRSARSKHKIAGYPKRYADTRTLVFFAPPGRRESGDSGWNEQVKTAFMLAGFIADNRVMREWLQERRARGEHGPLPVPAMTHAAAEWTRELTMHIQASGGTMNGADARAWLDSKGAPPDVSEAVVRRMQARDPAHRAVEEKAALAIGAGGLKLKPELVEQAKRMIAESPTLLKSALQTAGMLSFTALDARSVAEYMRQSGTPPWDHIRHDREALEAFARERADCRGNRPTAATAACASLSWWSWHGLDRVLRAVGSSLAIAIGRQRRTFDSAIAEILEWHNENGRWPRSQSVDQREKRLGNAIQSMRQDCPERLAGTTIPIRSNKSAAMRFADGRYHIHLLSNVIVLLAHKWRCKRDTALGTSNGQNIDRALNRVYGSDLIVDLCQINGISRSNAEIEADCWRFTLQGLTSPDPRPWAKLLASGDHKRIERAERVAFLDWKDSRLRGGTRWTDPRVGPGPKCPPAVRRPWTTPAPDGKPAKRAFKPKAGK